MNLTMDKTFFFLFEKRGEKKNIKPNLQPIKTGLFLMHCVWPDQKELQILTFLNKIWLINVS